MIYSKTTKFDRFEALALAGGAAIASLLGTNYTLADVALLWGEEYNIFVVGSIAPDHLLDDPTVSMRELYFRGKRLSVFFVPRPEPVDAGEETYKPAAKYRPATVKRHEVYVPEAAAA